MLVCFCPSSLHMFTSSFNQDTRKHWSSLKPKYLFVISLWHNSAGSRTAVTQWTVRYMFLNDFWGEAFVLDWLTTEPHWMNSVCLVLKYCCSIVLWVKPWAAAWSEHKDWRHVLISNVALKWFPCMPVIYRPRHGFCLQCNRFFFFLFFNITTNSTVFFYVWAMNLNMPLSFCISAPLLSLNS